MGSGEWGNGERGKAKGMTLNKPWKLTLVNHSKRFSLSLPDPLYEVTQESPFPLFPFAFPLLLGNSGRRDIVQPDRGQQFVPVASNHVIAGLGLVEHGQQGCTVIPNAFGGQGFGILVSIAAG